MNQATTADDLHIDSLDTLRFLAIVFVVINHLGLRPELYTFSVLTYATSPIMACISSYLMFRSLNQPREIPGKLKRRVNSIIVPYILWTFFTFIFVNFSKSILGTFTNIETFPHYSPPVWSISEYLVNYVVHPNPPTFWYLQNLILILPFTYFIYYLVKAKWSIVPIISLLMYSYNLEIIPIFATRFLPYYIFGAWLGTHYTNYIPSVRGDKYFLLVVAIVLMSINELIPSNWGGFVLICSFAIQTSLFLVSASLVRLFYDASILKFIRSKLHISFYLHAVHISVILLVLNTLMMGRTHFSAEYAIFRPVLPILVFLASFKLIDQLATQMMIRTPRIYNLLSGRRHA